MPTNGDIQDLPIKPDRVAVNRDDARSGEGPFVRLVSKVAAELVTPNGLQWNNDHDGYCDSEASLPLTRGLGPGSFKPGGARAPRLGLEDNKPLLPRRRYGGNRSGE
jgi:hypothetical protein